MTAGEARGVFDRLLREVVRMLCAGVVHGDLSDFNVLMGASGPVLIDFPQWVDASRNQNARTLLIRDVDNLTDFLGRFEGPPPRKDREPTEKCFLSLVKKIVAPVDERAQCLLARECGA